MRVAKVDLGDASWAVTGGGWEGRDGRGPAWVGGGSVVMETWPVWERG